MPITLDGTLGITTPGLTNTGTETIVNLTTTGNTILGDASTDTLNVGNGGLVKDASGNVGIGTASPSAIGKVLNLYGSASVGSSIALQADNGAQFCTIYQGITAADPTSIFSNNGFKFATATAKDATGFSERMRLDSSGNLGLGVTPSAWRTAVGTKALQIGGSVALFSQESSGTYWTTLTSNAFQNTSNVNAYINTGFATSYTQTSGQHFWGIAPSGTAGNAITFTQAMTLNSSGNLGLGVTPSAWGGGFKAIQVSAMGAVWGSSAATYLSSNEYFDGSSSRYITTQSATDYAQYNGQHVWFTAPSGTAGNAITFTQAMTLDASGNLLVGTTSTQFCTLFTGAGSVIRNPTTTTNTKILEVAGGTDTSVPTFAVFYNANNTAMNSANSVVKIGLMAATGRSINAAGTINASGADYAEYMTKAGNFTVAKGDVVGINADGKLTNVFADAVSFVVKSTSPSYVGGDVWGTPEALGLLTPEKPSQRQATEEVEAETDADFAVRQTQYEADQSAFDAALEAVRQLVDRIAFAGQVPVNVLGAAAGQYIVPVNDNGAIKGEAVSNPTFEQYQTAVGKVIAIEADGRARIIVKVA